MAISVNCEILLEKTTKLEQDDSACLEPESFEHSCSTRLLLHQLVVETVQRRTSSDPLSTACPDARRSD